MLLPDNPEIRSAWWLFPPHNTGPNHKEYTSTRSRKEPQDFHDDTIMQTNALGLTNFYHTLPSTLEKHALGYQIGKRTTELLLIYDATTHEAPGIRPSPLFGNR